MEFKFKNLIRNETTWKMEQNIQLKVKIMQQMCISSTRKYTLPFALVFLLLIHLVDPTHKFSDCTILFSSCCYFHSPKIQLHTYAKCSASENKKNRGEEEEEAEGERDVHVRVLTLTLMRVIILDLQFSLLIKISPALESKKKNRKIHGIALHFALFFSSELMACFWPDNNECLFSPSSDLHSSFCISFNI